MRTMMDPLGPKNDVASVGHRLTLLTPQTNDRKGQQKFGQLKLLIERQENKVKDEKEEDSLTGIAYGNFDT